MSRSSPARTAGSCGCRPHLGSEAGSSATRRSSRRWWPEEGPPAMGRLRAHLRRRGWDRPALSPGRTSRSANTRCAAECRQQPGALTHMEVRPSSPSGSLRSAPTSAPSGSKSASSRAPMTAGATPSIVKDLNEGAGGGQCRDLVSVAGLIMIGPRLRHHAGDHHRTAGPTSPPAVPTAAVRRVTGSAMIALGPSDK